MADEEFGAGMVVWVWRQFSEAAAEEEAWARAIAEEEAKNAARRGGAAVAKARRPGEPFGGVDFASLPAGDPGGGGDDDDDDEDDDEDDESTEGGSKRAQRRLQRARARARAGAALVLGFLLYLPWLAGLCLGGGLRSKDKITRYAVASCPLMHFRMDGTSPAPRV